MEMELTCAFVFILGSLVTATPHGYGTKGGASAKAEASAIAGSFGGFGGAPVDIPNNAGYSGSYSKSSSSSFSSASASSSSSSSSFSYNGVGAGGFPGSASIGSAAPSAGCGSGGCQFGSKDLGTHGSSGTGNGIAYNGANAAASAGAGGITGCGPSGCNTGGSHGPTGVHGNSGTGVGSQANSDFNSAIPTGTECGTAGCTSGGSQGLPNNGGTGTGYQANGKANSAASADAGATTGLTKSSNHVGQNQPSECNGANCKLSSTGSKCTYGSCGSDTGDNDICVSGQCGSSSQTVAPSTDYSPSVVSATSPGVSGFKSNYDSKDQSNSNYDKHSLTGSDCSYGNCGPAGSSYSKPVYPHGSSNTYQGSPSQNYQPPKCDSPNCNGNNYDSSPISGNIAAPGYNKPAIYLTTPKQGSECTTPNCQSETGSSEQSSFVPLHTFESSQPGGPSCSSGNCANSQPLPTSYLGPVNCAGGSCAGSAPTQSSGIDQTGSLGSKHPGCAPGTPNCAGSITGFPSSPSGAGSYTPESGLPSYSSPSTGTQTGLSSAGSHALGSGVSSYNAPSAGFPTSQSGVDSHAPGFGLSSYNKPSAGFPTGQSGIGSHASGSGLPSYNVPNTGSHTPGSGPSSYNTPSTDFPSSQSGAGASHAPGSGVPSYITPSIGSNVISCKTPNCADQTFAIHSQPDSFGTPKPISPSSQKLPPYTGGFGGPSGILKPGEYSAPESGYPYKPTTASVNPASCSSGLCGPQPGYTSPTYVIGDTASGPHASSGAQHHPSTQNGARPSTSAAGTYDALSIGGVLSNCRTPDCANQASGITSQPGSSGNKKPSGESTPSQKLPTYTGGFGGPAGILKPDEYSVPTSGYHQKPTTSSGTYSPTSCSSGHCGSQPGHTSPTLASGSAISGAQATASAEANANAVAYTGGFGGPPGLLNPYDSGKLGSSAPSGKQEFGSHQGATHDQKAGSQGVGAQASAVAQASATANSVAYGGNSHGDYNGNGFKETAGCGGGCGGSGGSYNGGANLGASREHDLSKLGSLNGFNSGLNTSGATAKSQAGASSGAGFGHGGSYASSSASAHASSGVKGGYGRR